MMKRFFIAAFAMLIFAVMMPNTANAQAQGNESWTIGGGYWTMPDIGGSNDSGFYASIAMGSTNYQLEFDYSLDKPNFYALAADYIYPLSEMGYSQQGPGTSAYVGLGYTYFACDDLDNVSGFNLLLGADFGDNLVGRIRYDMLKSDQNLITFGVQYGF